MVFKGIFVDDEDPQYARLLSTTGVLEFDHQDVLPITEQALAVRSAAPVVVALDYRLDEMTPNVPAGHTYKGSALAQLLRDAAIADPTSDFGIILVSNEMKLKSLYAPDKTAHDLFDMVYSKKEVINDRVRVRREVVALSEAYISLRSAPRYDPMQLLAAEDQDREYVEVQEIVRSMADAAAPHLISKFVLRTIIERPGLLIGDDDAAARLGIHVDDFEKLVDLLLAEQLGYQGIFSSGWRRWWTHRLEEFAERALQGRPLSLTALERAARLSELTGLQLRPAPSPWDKSTEEYISFACASCHRPTELRHSLAAFDPKAPSYGLRRRICWDCIQTDAYKAKPVPLIVDETDEDLVAEIAGRSRAS